MTPPRIVAAAVSAVLVLVVSLVALGPIPKARTAPVVPPPPPLSAEGLEAIGFNDLDQPIYCNTEVAQLGQAAFLSSWCGMNDRGVTIVDASDPSVPMVLTRTEIITGQYTWGIEALHLETEGYQGDVLVEPVGTSCSPGNPASEPAYLRLWNVDEPATPELLSSTSIVDSANHVHAFRRDGRQLVLLSMGRAESQDNSACGWEEQDHDSSLLVMDITEPQAPEIIGSWKLGERWPDEVAAANVYRTRTDAAGQRAYVAIQGVGMIILDLTDLSAPSAIGRYTPEDRPIFSASAMPLPDGRHVALADQRANPHGAAFEVLSPTQIAGPTPSDAGWHIAPLAEQGLSELVGEPVWVGRGCDPDANNGLEAPDPYLGDPSGRIALVQRGACSFANKIARAQAEGAVGVVIFNHLPNVGPPTMGGFPLDGVTIPGLGISNEDGLAISATLASGVTPTVRLEHVPGSWGYTRILDVSDPAEPVEVAEITIEETRAWPPVGAPYDWYSAFDLMLDGSLLYVSSTGAGVRVVDVSEPREPRELAHFVPPDRVSPDGTHTLNQVLDSTIGDDGLVYVADEISGLWILDASYDDPPPIYLPSLLANGSPTDEVLPAPSGDWCERVQGGAAGAAELPFGVALAHIDTRIFGTASTVAEVDQALASALGARDALAPEGIAAALASYAEALPGVCAIPTDDRPLPPASAEAASEAPEVAIVRPGSGELSLPVGTTAVVLDLRDLPAAEGLREALQAAIAPALHTPVEAATRIVRRQDGLTDEIFSATNVYSNGVAVQIGESITGTAATDLPIALLTDEAMAPAAAELAGALRLQGRAWLVGEGLRAEVASSEWRSVGAADVGLAMRQADLAQLREAVTVLDLEGQTAQQDDPDDPGSSSYRQGFEIREGDVRRLVAQLDAESEAEDDLDLFLLYDADADGVLRYPEDLVGQGVTGSGDETADLYQALSPGAYEVWVHGWGLAGDEALFDLEVRVQRGQDWPDEIFADLRASDPLAAAVALMADAPSALPEPAVRVGSRATIQRLDPYQKRQPVTLGLGEARAALLITHGALRRFFPYFDVVGDTIDDRLMETLATVDSWEDYDRDAMLRLIRRYGEAIHDGHQFSYDYGPVEPYGLIPVFLDEIDGLPVIRHSYDEALHPGDTILSIDGRASSDWYAEEYTRTSAASDGYRFDLASRRFRRIEEPTTLTLRDPDGAERSVTVSPQANFGLLAPTLRESGPLDDHEAPELYYLSMNGNITNGIQGVRDALAAAMEREAAGLVVDMRAYPGGINHYEVARRLIREPFRSPQFVVPYYTGPGELEWSKSQYDLTPMEEGPIFNGPIALLTGPHAVSAAENFMLMLVDDPRVTVVGRPSAATNGNITGVQLPGSFAFSFTGMDLLRPDGSVFHGIGIQPDVPVALSAEDFRDGIDRDLVTAIEVLKGAVTKAGPTEFGLPGPAKRTSDASLADARSPDAAGEGRLLPMRGDGYRFGDGQGGEGR